MHAEPVDAALTSLHTVRRTNREAQRRASVIANVMERLDVFATLLVTRSLPNTEAYDALRRDHATRIVEAVLALSKENPS